MEFKGPEYLCRKLLKHVLREPEQTCWQLVLQHDLEPGALSELRSRLESIEETERTQQSKVAFKVIASSRDLRQLAEGYLEAAERAIENAKRLGWWTQDRGERCSFDCFGVFAIENLRRENRSVLRTTYIPTPASTDGHVSSTSSSSLQRGSAMRRHVWLKRLEQEQERRRKRACNYSEEQSLYYFVFRPAVEKIKSAQPSSNEHHQEMMKLKTILPDWKQLNYSHWRRIHLGHQGQPSSASDREVMSADSQPDE